MKAKTCRRSTCVDMLSFLQPSSASQLLQGQMFEPRWLFTGSLPREMTAIFFASPSNFSWSGKKYQDHHIHIQNLRLKTYYQSPTSLPIFKKKDISQHISGSPSSPPSCRKQKAVELWLGEALLDLWALVWRQRGFWHKKMEKKKKRRHFKGKMVFEFVV